MNRLDSFLPFVFNHQIIIIESLFATILAIVIVWLFTHLRSESIDVDDTVKSISDIEEALKRVIEATAQSPKRAQEAVQAIKDEDNKKPQTSQATPVKGKAAATIIPVASSVTPTAPPATAPTTAAAGTNAVAATTTLTTPPTPASTPPAPTPAAQGASVAPDAKLSGATQAAATPTPAATSVPTPAPAAANTATASSTEAEKLKAEELDKSKKVENLEKALSETKAEIDKAKQDPARGAESAGLKEKVKNLEERLAEYEIIEDDIANLNFYKKENSRLKEEMEKLKAKAGGPIAVDELEAKPSAKSGNLITPAKDSDSAAAKTIVTPSSAAAAASSAAPLENKSSADSEKLLGEFDKLASATAGGGTPAPNDRESSEKLLAEFESFMREGQGQR